ncbi:MAG: ABC transporter permease [Planctomycetaceae bacterium]|nr:ABC transporter permease [Planctomycetaceae bacterium]
MSRKLLLTITAPIVVTILIPVVWTMIVRAGAVSSVVVPEPLAVLKAADQMTDVLWPACKHTAQAAALGLTGSIMAGVLIACLFSQSEIARTALYPWAILLQTVPIIAVAPIVVVTFGRGFYSVALISMIVSIFPVITSTTTGLLQTDPNLLDLFRLHSATRFQRLWKLQLPSALPYIISGIRIAGGASVVGAIVGEFFVGSGESGLGTVIQLKSARFKMDELYAVVLASTLLGVTTFTVITLSGEFVLRRYFGTSLGGTRSR